MWVEFAPRGFSAGIPLFPFPQKPTSPNSNSNRNQVDGEPLCGCATYKSLFIYFIEVFIYLIFRGPAPSLISNLSCFFLVLRHSAVHSAIVFLPLVWLWSRREKCKNRSVFWVSAECEWKRYLPTVVLSNTFTVNYLFFSKVVLKKLNYIKICLYLKLKRLRRDSALYKLRKEKNLKWLTEIVCTTWSSPWILQKSLFLWTRREGTPKLNSRKSKTILKIVCSCFGQVEGQLNLQRLT